MNVDAGAHFVDLQVGARIRMLRRAAKMSQTALGDRIGLTFQQVQKYERGANRVSASKLYEIAAALGVPVTSVFEGLPANDGEWEGAAPTSDLFALAHVSGGQVVAEYFPRIKSAQIRHAVAELVRTLAVEAD